MVEVENFDKLGETLLIDYWLPYLNKLDTISIIIQIRVRWALYLPTNFISKTDGFHQAKR